MEGKIMGEKKNKPFYYLKPNQCRSCGGKLELVDEDIAVAKLDSKGLPMWGDSYTNQRLRCPKCGSEFDCVKQGMSFVIAPTAPPIQPIMKGFNPFYQ